MFGFDVKLMWGMSFSPLKHFCFITKLSHFKIIGIHSPYFLHPSQNFDTSPQHKCFLIHNLVWKSHLFKVKGQN